MIPDYICNIMFLSAKRAGIPYHTYRTDEQFRPDIENIGELLKSENVCAILFASILGTQNNTSNILQSIREIAPEVTIIFDECQNIITNSPLKMDKHTVVVISFNNKTVPGLMGGALCFPLDARLEISPPVRKAASKLRYELLLWAVLGKRILKRFQGVLMVIGGKVLNYELPSIEFSVCGNDHYDVEPNPASKLSMIYAYRGLCKLPELENLRRANYNLLNEEMKQRGEKIVIETDLIEISPYIPVQLTDIELFKYLPIKGPYSIEEDSTQSHRPDVFCIKNNNNGISYQN